MNRRPRRNHTPAFKAKVALAAVKGDRTIARFGRVLRCSPQSDYGVEGPDGGWRFWSFWTWGRGACHAGGRCEVAARQDRGVDAGE